MNSGYEYYPILKDVLPPQLLSIKPQQKQQDKVNVILTWDIGNVKWSASTLKVPIREYNPNKGYYWRDATLKEYHVVHWSVVRDDLSLSE